LQEEEEEQATFVMGKVEHIVFGIYFVVFNFELQEDQLVDGMVVQMEPCPR
jgi:hypothetical protein